MSLAWAKCSWIVGALNRAIWIDLSLYLRVDLRVLAMANVWSISGCGFDGA